MCWYRAGSPIDIVGLAGEDRTAVADRMAMEVRTASAMDDREEDRKEDKVYGDTFLSNLGFF